MIFISNIALAKSECESNDGYCIDGNECKVNHINRGSGMYGCSETQICCLPCVGEDEEWVFGRIDKYYCCEGLTPLAVSRSNGYCTKCGDGVCKGAEDTLTPSGEKLCPQDCEVIKTFSQKILDWLKSLFK
ncbi:MAG: hypothetical protein KAT77_00670 [Nanoarchaeota archaeon]|nr:hypothetical protein [Nanoarchaeota archaeon]